MKLRLRKGKIEVEQVNMLLEIETGDFGKLVFVMPGRVQQTIQFRQGRALGAGLNIPAQILTLSHSVGAEVEVQPIQTIGNGPGIRNQQRPDAIDRLLPRRFGKNPGFIDKDRTDFHTLQPSRDWLSRQQYPYRDPFSGGVSILQQVQDERNNARQPNGIIR